MNLVNNNIIFLTGHVFFHNGQDVCPTRNHLSDITACMGSGHFIGRNEGDNWCSIFNQGNGSMFQFTCCKSFTLDVGNFLQFEGCFDGYIVVISTTNVKGVAGYGQEILYLFRNGIFFRKGCFDGLRYDRQLMHQIKFKGFFLAIGFANCLRQKGKGRHLRCVSFCRSYRNFWTSMEQHGEGRFT